MIQVESQCLLKLEVGGQDIADEESLKSFKLVEEAGNVLPMFEMQVDVINDDLLRYLHEGVVLKVTLGRPPAEGLECASISTELKVLRKLVLPGGLNSRVLYCSGVYNALNYMVESRTGVSKKKSALEVMADVADRNGFKVDADPSSSNDSQNWVQWGTSDKRFVNHLWYHTDLGSTTPLVGITSDGQFKVRAWEKLVGSPNWKFSQGDGIITQNIEADEVTGFFNMWQGYGKRMQQKNADTGSADAVSGEVAAVMTDALNRSPDVGLRGSPSRIITGNHHANFWQAYLNNMARLATYGILRVPFLVTTHFKPFQVLDSVQLTYPEMGENLSPAPFQGFHVIARVTRFIKDRQFFTALTMCREATDQKEGIPVVGDGYTVGAPAEENRHVSEVG